MFLLKSVVPSVIMFKLDLLMNICSLQWAQPATEAGTYFIIGTLWLGKFYGAYLFYFLICFFQLWELGQRTS